MLLNSKQVITGSSVHNQRIERLWRDVFRCVFTVFYQLFHYLEEEAFLSPLSSVDLYCLHKVYIPIVNNSLSTFQNGWNNHAITSEHAMTPLQLMVTGALVSHDQEINVPIALSRGFNHEQTTAGYPATVQCEIDSLDEMFDSQQLSVIENILSSSGSGIEADNYQIDVYCRLRDYVYACIFEHT